jgi:hypothetical protein
MATQTEGVDLRFAQVSTLSYIFGWLVTHHVKNSFHFIKILESLQVQPGDLMVSFDIVSLFNKVPVGDSLSLLSHHFENSTLALFKHVLTSTYFCYDGQFYEQTDGVEMGYLAAAKQYNVTRSTLCDYVRSNWDPFQATQSKLGRKPIISPALEETLVEYLLITERNYFGCTREDVRRLAFQLAVRNKVPNTFSITKEAAGKEWFKRLVKRYSDKLSLRHPTGTSTASHRIQQGTNGNFL